MATQHQSNGSSTSTGTLPASITKTGTIASVGTQVRGTGTNMWNNDILEGDYLYNNGDNGAYEVRQIVMISPNTELLEIESAFAHDLPAGTVFKVVRGRYRKLHLKVGAATAKINNVTYAIGADVTLGDDRAESTVNPIAFDATSSTLTWEAEY